MMDKIPLMGGIKEGARVIGNAVNDIKGNYQEAKQSILDSMSGKTNPFSAGANVFKNATEAALSPISEALKPALMPLIQKLAKANDPTGEKSDRLLEMVNEHPTFWKTFGDLFQGGLNTIGLYGLKESITGAKQYPTSETPNAKFTPEFAKSAATQMDESFDVVDPTGGLKSQFRNSIDLNNTSQPELFNSAKQVMESYAKTQPPEIQAKIDAQIPHLEAMSHSGTMSPSAIGNEMSSKTVYQGQPKFGTPVAPKSTKYVPLEDFNDTSMIKEGGQIKPEQAQSSAWKDIQPKDTNGVKLAYAKGGNTTEQTLLEPGRMKPSEADTRLLDTQSQLYEDGTLKDSMSPNEKQAAVQQKAKQLHGDQVNFLKDHDKAVSLNATDVKGEPIGLFDKLDATANEGKLPFAKETTLTNAYDSVIDVYKSKLATGKSAGSTKGATTLSAASEALTAFDQTMAKFGAYKKTATGELTDSAQVRQNAIRDVHEAVRDYIAEQLPKNSPWKSIRDQESRLYDISDRLAQRITEGMSEGKIEQTVNKNPILKRLPGVGTGMKIIK